MARSHLLSRQGDEFRFSLRFVATKVITVVIDGEHQAHFAWLARRTPLPVIALGGMNPTRGRRLASFGAYGWAGIDAWG